MGADHGPSAARTGIYEFQMPQPIPPYLIALAVGDIEFVNTGDRTGVYALQWGRVLMNAEGFQVLALALSRCRRGFNGAAFFMNAERRPRPIRP